MFNDPPGSPEPHGTTGQKRPRSPSVTMDDVSSADKAHEAADNSSVPKPKRLACMICRKRKLKCDGVRPSCSTCARLGHSCAYDEVRRKSGPKRGYVKALEERLKQVETLLNKSQDPTTASSTDASRSVPLSLNTGSGGRSQAPPMPTNLGMQSPSLAVPNEHDMNQWQFGAESPQPGAALEDFNMTPSMPMNMNGVGNNFAWDLIGLGLEEPLPPQETIDELHQIFFEKVHPSLPMIHKYRYLAAMNLAPNQRPPVALRYAIWTMACSITDKFADLKDLFYQRARKYVEADYIKGYGEHMISVAHAQTHILLASYEFKMMYFPRAWMNTGSAVRLCQMIGLHRLDGAGLDVKQSLPPPRDWTEREERRRTFWMAFCEDRYASIGTGWPMTIDEKDIMTNLPSSDEAFDMSRPEQTQTLPECMSPAGAMKLSSFGGIVLMACLFGRNLIHLHRPDVDDRDNDLNGEFWKRHRSMDNILLNTSLCLPPSLKLPQGLGSPNIVFTNMSIHTSTICLHQAAIFKADKNKLPATVSAESKVRCITAANEIASTMRMISHMDLSSMNPFISFCLYVAARVFVQYLKSRPDDSQTVDSLRFLLTAMNALKRRNPLTESFLVQLDVDLEALGMKIPKLRTAFPRSTDSPDPGNSNSKKCDDNEGLGIMVYIDSEKDPEAARNAAAAAANSKQPQQQQQQGSYQNCGWRSSDGHLSMPGVAVTPAPSSVSGNGAGGGMGQQSESSGENNMGASPDGGDQSNRPTPGSSITSDQQQQRNAGGGGGASGSHTSFDTSPVSETQQSHNVANHAGGMDGGGGSFYPDPQYAAAMDGGTGMTPGRFAVGDGSENFGMTPGGWQNMQGQPGMTPLSEGVLRSLINMGPMDAMDMGNWNGNR